MDSSDKKKINQNLSSLVERTQLDSGLETKLIEKNVFNDVHLERIRTSGDSQSQKRKLFKDVQTRGPFAFKSMIEALAETGNINAARILDPDAQEPVEDATEEKSKVWNQPIYEQPRQSRVSAPVPPVWENNTTPLTVKVIKTAPGVSNNRTNVRTYKMDSVPRGLALIIDNENFDNEVLPTRTGSLVDSNNLDELFLQLGFKVTLRRNLSYYEMIQEIQKFAAKPEHRDVDMCAVVVMSHGRHGLVAAADGRELETEWLLRQFNNYGCPALKGKPKFFILQSCRGDEQDHGVVPKPTFPEDRFDSDASVIQGNQPPGSKFVTDGFREVTWEDMLVSYATLPGYVANRDKYRGTWFIECLCKVFMENAHSLEVREMLDEVAAKLKNFESEFGTKQSCAYEVRNFYKKLYFNPQ